MNTRRGLVIAGYLVLAAIAALGWARKPEPAHAGTYYPAARATYANPETNADPTAASERPAVGTGVQTNVVPPPCSGTAKVAEPATIYQQAAYSHLSRPYLRARRGPVLVIPAGALSTPRVPRHRFWNDEVTVVAGAPSTGGFTYDRLTHER